MIERAATTDAHARRVHRGASACLACVLALSSMMLDGCAHGPRDVVPNPPAAPPLQSAQLASPPGPTPTPNTRLAPIAIATGSERETDFRIGRDLAEFVAADAGMALDVRATKGSAENMHLLRDDPAVDLAIVQYDVVQALIEQAANGNAAAKRLVEPLRVVTPLYTQEIYLVVRSDSPMKSMDEIRGRRINVGARGSGSALTIASLYARMFGVPLPAANARYLSDDRALAALTLDKTVDVVAVVAGQPAKLFADMKPQARQFIKLLRVDDRKPATKSAYKAYFPATIRSSSYASWLDADVPTMSVLSFLVTSDVHSVDFAPLLASFVQSLCRNFATLKARGHPKWREVQLGMKVGLRWTYAAASESEFERCVAARPMSAATP